MVLPVPGGPYSSTPFHGESRPVKCSGYLRGSTSDSDRTRFTPSNSAISPHPTEGFDCTTSRMIHPPKSLSSACPKKVGGSAFLNLRSQLSAPVSPPLLLLEFPSSAVEAPRARIVRAAASAPPTGAGTAPGTAPVTTSPPMPPSVPALPSSRGLGGGLPGVTPTPGRRSVRALSAEPAPLIRRSVAGARGMPRRAVPAEAVGRSAPWPGAFLTTLGFLSKRISKYASYSCTMVYRSTLSAST
mmetsp:Transcript_5440/g.14216  ORF Transcript_5440/g.14216 Transcript_5440/m.14216 type:complete len:243 (+) Transcript_5440:937-1665(+)